MSSLPERPDLDFLREKAKDLLRQYRAGDSAAFLAFRSHLPAAQHKIDSELSAMALQLADAQSCLARQHGFASWQKLKEHIEQEQGQRAVEVFDPKNAGTSSAVYSDIARLRYEQARPRTPFAFEPTEFDQYVGYYQSLHSPIVFTHIFRIGRHFLEQLNIEKRAGVPPVEFFPESSTKVFATVVASQISFVLDGQQKVTGLIFHQNGYERLWSKVEEAVVEAYEASLEERFKANSPSPGTEGFVRRFILGWAQGTPELSQLSPQLLEVVQGQRQIIEYRARGLGALVDLSFKCVDRDGRDVYEAKFAGGQQEYRITPLNDDGKVAGFSTRPLP